MLHKQLNNKTMKDKLIKLLKKAYDEGYEDGFTFGSNGVKCNDFDDVLIENNDLINELCHDEELKPCNPPNITNCPGVEACEKTDDACIFYDPCNDCDLS